MVETKEKVERKSKNRKRSNLIGCSRRQRCCLAAMISVHNVYIVNFSNPNQQFSQAEDCRDYTVMIAALWYQSYDRIPAVSKKPISLQTLWSSELSLPATRRHLGIVLAYFHSFPRSFSVSRNPFRFLTCRCVLPAFCSMFVFAACREVYLLWSDHEHGCS